MTTRRIDGFLALIEGEGVCEIHRLRLTTTGPLSDPRHRDVVPICQHLAFGKTRWHPRELEWVVPLSTAEIDDLRGRRPWIRTSEAAAYPELESGWSVLNRVVDVCLVGSHEAVEARWQRLLAEAQAQRLRQHRVVEALLAALGDVEGISCVAVRGQAGSADRLPSNDIDLLLLLRDVSCYGPVLAVARRFALAHGVGRLSWLGTDFGATLDEGLVVDEEVGAGPRVALDLHATVGPSELARVLRGDPAEAHSNLEVLHAARAVWGAEVYAGFVADYRRVLSIRARGRIREPPQGSPVSWAPVVAAELRVARARGLEALGSMPPRVELWDDRGSQQAMLSPFVAALAWEAGAREHAERYLEATMEHGGTWRFAPHADQPWPPDVDDTACAAAALLGAKRLPVAISEIVGRLEARCNAEGLLETWMLEPAAHPGRRNDADATVTANALLLLHRGGHGGSVLAQRLAAGVLAAVARGAVASHYYHSQLVQAAFIARWAAEAKTPAAAAVLAVVGGWLDAVDVRALSAMELAAVVAAASWCGLDALLRDAVPRLLATQEDEGTWPTGVAFVDPGGGRYGSRALSTAMALVALGAAEPFLE